MNNLTFLNFCKKLLTEPIEFLDTYFKEDKVVISHKKNLNKILYQFTIFQILIDLFLEVTHALFFSVTLEEKIVALISLLFGLVFVFLFRYLILPIVYKVSCWYFQEIIYWTGGTITAKKGINLRLYIIAHMILLSSVSYPLEVILEVLSWWKFDLLFFLGSIFLSIVTIMIMVRSFYVNYKIIQKTTNAPPLLAVFLDVVIAVILITIFMVAIAFIKEFYELLIQWICTFEY